MSKPKSTLAGGLGDLRSNFPMRDIADGMGNFTGRVAQQKLSATMRADGVRDNARSRGLEYTR